LKRAPRIKYYFVGTCGLSQYGKFQEMGVSLIFLISDPVTDQQQVG
jgi:hypothetical protein